MICIMGRKQKKVDLYAGKRPVDIPTYTFSEAASYLGMPVSTLRSWIVGQKYQKKYGEGFFKPLIHLSTKPGEAKLLSFTNLIEAHVLDAMRRVHGVAMYKVRETLDYVLKHIGTKNPLAHIDFQTDGVDLIIKELDTLVFASSHGQTAMKDMLDTYLQRIERNEKGVAEKLYPFTRGTRSIDEPKVIVIDPRISFGRPVIEGTGIPVSTLVSRFIAGESYSELAEDYSCDHIMIEEAIRCALPKAA